MVWKVLLHNMLPIRPGTPGWTPFLYDKCTRYFYVNNITLRTFGFMSHLKEKASWVKFLAQGHMCHNPQSNLHYSDVWPVQASWILWSTLVGYHELTLSSTALPPCKVFKSSMSLFPILYRMHIVNGTFSERALYRLAFDVDQNIPTLFPDFDITVHDCNQVS